MLPFLICYSTGGPAEGNADQLPVSGGRLHSGFIKTTTELIKKLHPSGGVGEWGKWKRTTSKGRDQRQEEGIPSPSLQMRSGIEGTPLPFVFYSQGELLKSPNLRSHMVETLHTVNKRHSWEVFIFAFQTRDHGSAHKICGSKEPRFKNRL